MTTSRVPLIFVCDAAAVGSIADLTRRGRGIYSACYFSHPSGAPSGRRLLAKTDETLGREPEAPLHQTPLSAYARPKMRLTCLPYLQKSSGSSLPTREATMKA